MNYQTSRWTDQVWRAILTVLATAVGVCVAWHLLHAVLGPLLVVAGVLMVIRLALGLRISRDGWWAPHPVQGFGCTARRCGIDNLALTDAFTQRILRSARDAFTHQNS